MLQAAAAGQSPQRVLAVDVLRGLVLLFLLPDLAGGFSFYAVAQALPESPVWRGLAAQFGHVEWTGVALWDLVMPLFVFLVGVSMALSYTRRRHDGQSEASLLTHAALRSVALFLLGMLLQFKPQTRFDELLPFLVLSTGLPVGRAWRRLIHGGQPGPTEAVETTYTLVVLLVAALWLALHYPQLGHYEIGSQILALLGLAYLPAFLLQRAGLSMQALAIVAVLGLYGLAFALYSGAPVRASTVGEVFTGAFAPWNAGANLGAAFDDWFFSSLPRAEPYRGNPHDYQSLLFVPLIAAILFGALVGRVLAQQGPSRRLALVLTAGALAGMALACVMSETVAPLLKSLWTPTWAVFSSSACLLLLGVLMFLFGKLERAGWALPLVVLGTNSMLLYVLSFTQRWRIVKYWGQLFDGLAWPSIPWWPLVESCLVLATFWLLAAVLYRAKVFVRL